MTVHVALLRGINVGAHNRIGMPKLREALGELGYDDVQTYLQSGNVVVRGGRSAEQVAEDVRKASGLDVDVMVRTGAHVAKLVDDNPYPQVKDGKTLHVAFLEGGKPALPEEDFAPEACQVVHGELFVWLPDRMQNSPLVKALADRKLGVTSTWRNWNTVLALQEMCSG